MNAQRRARGGQRRATIRNGLMFFLADDLSSAKPVPEEDRGEYALGIALVHYSMGAGIKKFKERGEAGVTKELTQMHDGRVPPHEGIADEGREDEFPIIAYVSEGEAGSICEGPNVCRRLEAEGRLDKAGDYVAYCINGGSFHCRSDQRSQRT
jgi:hypothetical protein